ncbi:MAG: nuclear transport factor 2 family protein [Gammaproteobacteria bacterium]|nr:nuclear transport factor 2 family protein [Gammaproteobacteria bacterium]
MSETVITSLENALRAAQLSADIVSLDRLIADDLLFIGPMVQSLPKLMIWRHTVMGICALPPMRLRHFTSAT